LKRYKRKYVKNVLKVVKSDKLMWKVKKKVDEDVEERKESISNN
jgi:hypothetical protein